MQIHDSVRIYREQNAAPDFPPCARKTGNYIHESELFSKRSPLIIYNSRQISQVSFSTIIRKIVSVNNIGGPVFVSEEMNEGEKGRGGGEG